MSDQRIHLFLQWDDKYLNYDNWVLFPNGKKVYLIDIEGVDELVRSLAAHDSREIDVCYCNQCSGKIFWDSKTRYNPRSDKWDTSTIAHCVCGQGKHIPNLKDPLTYNRKKEQEFDSKIKVTFGSGTYLIIEESTPLYKGLKRIIEPLDPIKQLCDELGIEILYA